MFDIDIQVLALCSSCNAGLISMTQPRDFWPSSWLTWLVVQVTWVEHAEVEDNPVHQIFNNFVNSRMAFGAQRWLAILQRQCERLASLMARSISDLGGTWSIEFLIRNNTYFFRFSLFFMRFCGWHMCQNKAFHLLMKWDEWWFQRTIKENGLNQNVWFFKKHLDLLLKKGKRITFSRH